jgi:hypothetical protein
MKSVAALAPLPAGGDAGELRNIERAVTTGTRDAGRGLATELRRQVASVGLGQRLANSWRDQHYPNQSSMPRAWSIPRRRRSSARSMRGVIRSRRTIRGVFPEHRFGPLWFVPRQTGPSLLVVDGLRLLWWTACASYSRQTGQLRGFRRATERARRSGHGLTTVVMFLLVPQVKLSKRLDVARAAEH